MKAVERIKLSRMPFDKFENNQFVHATGYMIELEDGSWEIEYEDMEYEDAPGCKYSNEEDDEEELEENHCIYIYDDEMTEA